MFKLDLEKEEESENESCTVVSNSLQPHGLWGHKDLDMTERLSTGKHTVKGFSLINEVKADIFLIPLPFL